MSYSCSITTCKRASRFLFIPELNPLIDDINLLNNRLNLLNIEKISEEYHKKLKEWRLDCYKTIDYLFEQKCQELNQLLMEKIKEQEEEISDVQTKLKGIFNDQETTRKDIDTITSRGVGVECGWA
ncbi:unnamed protein product [Rotaria sordida]|uniref:Uncharacterized protein n=1 Tax=Rotaria sordida TaxID=392033 RepID=A0A819GL63_9BILA|nr:unnamed protein product [Rotaria sordida]